MTSVYFCIQEFLNNFAGPPRPKDTSPLDGPQQDWFATQDNVTSAVPVATEENERAEIDSVPAPHPQQQSEDIPNWVSKKAEKKARREAKRAQREVAGEDAQEVAAKEPPPKGPSNRDEDDEEYWRAAGGEPMQETSPVRAPNRSALTPTTPQVESVTPPVSVKANITPTSIRSATPPPVVHRIQPAAYIGLQQGDPISAEVDDGLNGLVLPNVC